MSFIQTILIVLLTSGVAGSFVSWYLNRPKTKAETSNIDADTSAKQVASALLLVAQYCTENSKLVKRVEDL